MNLLQCLCAGKSSINFKIILAELLARNGALWNDLVEKDGFVEPRTESVLAAIARQRLAHLVVAYAA